jgi:hypothetical protein
MPEGNTVDVGPFHDQIRIDELLAERPDALDHIVWDTILRIVPRLAP